MPRGGSLVVDPSQLFASLGATPATTTGSSSTHEDTIRSYFLEPTHLVGESFSNDDDNDNDNDEDRWEPDEEVRRQMSIRHRPPRPGALWVINDPFSQSSSGSSDEPITVMMTQEQVESSGVLRNAIRPSSSTTVTRQQQQQHEQQPPRSREETNALAGRALRSKKGVYLIYCGGGGQETVVPRGFQANTGSRGGGGGCGALVCARGLVEGVPKRIFVDRDNINDNAHTNGNGNDEGEEEEDEDDGSTTLLEEGFSSDLPPSSIALGDVVVDEIDDQDHDGDDDVDSRPRRQELSGLLGERVGKRGRKNCRGCVTRDVACRRWSVLSLFLRVVRFPLALTREKGPRLRLTQWEPRRVSTFETGRVVFNRKRSLFFFEWWQRLCPLEEDRCLPRRRSRTTTTR